MIQEGSIAPDFTLQDKDGKAHSLSKLDARYVVLYFYPKDSTPGCTIEAHEFNRALSSFEDLGAVIVGVSGGDSKSKEKFCEKNKLKLLLLSDTDFSVSKKYGVYGEKSFLGRKYLGISRTTFVLDRSLKIISVFQDVKPLGHAKQVLGFLEVYDGKHK